MRHVIEAGTDASSLLLFDPGALPGGLERLFQTGSAEILERLDREGKVCWITTVGDGGYSLHAYVDERVPRELERCAVEPAKTSRPVGTGNSSIVSSSTAQRSSSLGTRSST